MSDNPLAEALAADGAAPRGPELRYRIILEGFGAQFFPDGRVLRACLARLMIRGIGGEEEALAHAGDVTVPHGGRRYVLADQDEIPAELRGYVQVAIDARMLDVYPEMAQRAEDAEPTLEFRFRPRTTVTRADAAVAISRYHTQYVDR